MTTDTRTITMIDIATPDIVGIQFSADRQTMWVCVDGICRLRIKGLAVADAHRAFLSDIGVYNER